PFTLHGSAHHVEFISALSGRKGERSGTMKQDNGKRNGKRSNSKASTTNGGTKPAKQPAIPPILLEGDATAPQTGQAGPGQRYALGPTPPQHDFGDAGESGELPESYGTKRLLLAARDPRWLYAHWDLTREQLDRKST